MKPIREFSEKSETLEIRFEASVKLCIKIGGLKINKNSRLSTKISLEPLKTEISETRDLADQLNHEQFLLSR